MSESTLKLSDLKLPEWATKPAKEMEDAGLDVLTILIKLAQYGPTIAQLVRQIIDAWNGVPVPPPPAVRGHCDGQGVLDLLACQQQDLLHALCHNMCAAACIAEGECPA